MGDLWAGVAELVVGILWDRIAFEVVNQVRKSCKVLVSPSEFIETRLFPINKEMCNTSWIFQGQWKQTRFGLALSDQETATAFMFKMLLCNLSCDPRMIPCLPQKFNRKSYVICVGWFLRIGDSCGKSSLPLVHEDTMQNGVFEWLPNMLNTYVEICHLLAKAPFTLGL